MSGARPKEPGRRIGPPTENRGRRRPNQQSSNGRPHHAQSVYMDHLGNYHPSTQEDGNWTVATGDRRHNRSQASRGRPSTRSNVINHHGSHYPSWHEYGIGAAGVSKHNRTDEGRGRGSRVRSPTSPNTGYNADRGRGRNNERKPVARALNMKDLKQLLEMQSPRMVQTLTNWAEMLKALLNQQKMSDDVIEILLRIFVRVFEYKESDKRKKAIDMVKDSIFFKSVLLSYTAHLGDNSKTNSTNENQLVQKIEKKIDLLSMFLEGFIPGLEDEINDIDVHITLLDATSKALFVKRRLSKEALIKVARLTKEAEKYITKAKEEEKKRRQIASAIREGIFDGPPPDDYRDIPILPTKDDLHSTEPPFLRPNKIKGSYSNHYHYLDVQFRLLREDFISPLRDGIQTHLSNVRNPLPRDQRKRNTDVRMYYDVKIEHPVFSDKGVHYRVKFSLGNLTRVKWQNTKRLIFGSLVCLSHDNFQTLLFGTVANREEELLCRGQVDLKLHNIENMENTRIYTMVESTAFFESYRPVLQVLQQFNEETIPMENYIVRASRNIEQPKYLRNQPGLMYDISALMKNKVSTSRLLSCLGGRPRQLLNDNKIAILNEQSWAELDNLILDKSQLGAVKAALTKEIAVIQGPPGTGKTYIGLKIVQTLLLNKHIWSRRRNGNNPIMVICYTNHALDQFLEGILKCSPQNLVRIGGRSKSEILAKFNLKELSRKCRRRRPEHFQQVIDSISEQMIRAEEMIKLCNKHILSEYALANVINDNHFRCLQDSREEYSVDEKRSTLPTWLGLLSTSDEHEKTDDIASGDEEEKGEQVDVPNTNNIMTEFDMLLHQREFDDVSDRKDYETRKKSVIGSLSSKLAYNPEMKCKDSPLKEHRAKMLKQLSIIDDEMTEQEANRFVNIRSLSPNNRWRLYRYWIAQYKVKLRHILFNQQQCYDRLGSRIQQHNNEAKCNVLRNANVIGMTTTGAAMNKELLNAVRPKIVIVEEAAEILEAHIVTSLTEQCEHLILIGDHQQLKPNPTVYKLATKYNLDTSLFERMLTNDVPCQKLSSQHRMRPEISNIMRRHFYSHLLDDESVNHFDDVKGVSHNLFFINHDFREESVEDILSKSNVHEAEYCIALAKYFFQQGYEASDITILTTYTGQVLNLKGILRNEKYACLNDIYVSAVDSYQGEENEIILLSLVRSNEAGNIGFLKVSNRMCVALSRARQGLFCIGNFKLLAERNDLWMKIVNDMRSSGRIGNHLELYCHNHPETKVEASVAKDFEQCPIGGCKLMCETRLECGHVCPMHCHPKDPHHEKYKCREACVRTCERGHPCCRPCFEKCPHCLVIVKKLFVPCGHDIQVKCYINSCQVPCEKLLACGHGCKTKCGDTCTEECKEFIDKTFECGHTVNVPCFTLECTMPCSRVGVCGHPCPNRCVESCGICLVKVRKELTCGHQEIVLCHEDVEYVICRQMCSETLSCGHQCKLKCCKPCSVSSCTELVKKKLKCEHEKEVPCNVNPETSYKHEDRYMRLDERFNGKYRRINQSKLLICNVKVNVTRKCGHEITIECWESSKIEEIKCLEKVVETLSCGHDVVRECSDISLCYEMCIRLLPCGHKCKEPCANECTDQCNEKVEKKLKCGHMKNVRCYVDVTEIVTRGEAACHFKKKVRLSCGHEETQLCCQSDLSVTCSNRCSKKLPCGHVCTKKCSQECTIDSCKQSCNTSLACGHVCKGNCKVCLHGQVHTTCSKICSKKLICGHICQQTCSIIPCRPCKEPCNSHCIHKTCRRTCADICEPCKSPCGWKCPHLRCTNACDEMCNRGRCNQPCHKTLRKCRHKCFGLCGEPCLISCLICDPAKYHPTKVKGIRPNYVFLYDCSHAIEVSEMDAYMDTDEGTRRKECPICHTTIRYNQRYGNVLKGIDMKITAIKRMTHDERSMQQVQRRRKIILARLSVLKTSETRKLLDEVNSRYGITYDRLLVINIMITLLERIDKIRIDLNRHRPSDIVRKACFHIFQQLGNVEKRVFNFGNSVPKQVLVDFSSELQRLNLCTQLEKLEHQVNTTSANSTQINDMLSMMLHTKIPVTQEAKHKVFSLIGPDSLEVSSDEPLVDMADKTINRSSSFCQENWSTCAMGHVLVAENRSEGYVHNCQECDASNSSKNTRVQPVNLPRGLSKGPNESEALEQKNTEESVSRLNRIQKSAVQDDNRELQVEQNTKTKNQRRRQRLRKSDSKSDNVNNSSKQNDLTAYTPTNIQRQRTSSSATMDLERTRTKQQIHEQLNSTAHSNTCTTATNRKGGSKTEKSQDQRKGENSNAAPSTRQRGSKSTSQTSEQQAAKGRRRGRGRGRGRGTAFQKNK